jgi:peptidoglycan/LPS O-acetylase OafA/YrhL
MQERYHALDSMRATMMLMGIYLHVVVGYSGDGHWPYIDAHPTAVLNWSLGLIHSFRMPAFFAMAGFFGALLWERRGPASFAANRGKRIVVPFLLFWSLLFPLMAAIVISLERGPGHIAFVVRSGELVKRLHPLHLWFLEYLILLYAIGAAAASLPRWDRLHRAFRWALQQPYAPAIFALFSWIPLGIMRGNLKDCDGFRPELLILSAYVGPFAFGWILYAHRDLLPRFQKHVGTYLVLAFFAFLLYGLTSGRTHPFMKAAGNVLLCWLLTFAVLGLFLRYANRPSPRWRYLSDSSYWLFIMHMPVVVGFQVAFRNVPLPALAKVPIVLALSAGVLLVSYDLLVRPTWIGALLNGRRYARGLPAQRQEVLQAA